MVPPGRDLSSNLRIDADLLAAQAFLEINLEIVFAETPPVAFEAASIEGRKDAGVGETIDQAHRPR